MKKEAQVKQPERSQAQSSGEVDDLKKQLAALGEERNTLYNDLLNAEGFIQTIQEQLKVAQSQPQPTANVDLAKAESKIKSLEQDLNRAQDALKERSAKVKELETEVQKLKQAESSRQAQNVPKVDDSEVAKLRR